MEKSFRLSLLNKIYLVLVGISAVMIVASISDGTPYQIGRFLGEMIVALVVSGVLAWVVWEFSQKNERSGNNAFSVALTLFLMASLVQVGRESEEQEDRQTIGDMQNKMENLKQQAANSASPEEIGEAYDELAQSAEQGFKKLAENSTGDEKRSYEILGAFIAEVQVVSGKWEATYDAVLEDRILDYERLTTDQEFLYQKQVINTYLQEAAAYHAYFHQVVPDLKQKFRDSGIDEKLYREAMRGAENKYNRQKAVFDPLMRAHLLYGKSMIKMLDILQENKETWFFEDGELLIDNDDVLEEFNRAFNQLAESETAIQELSLKLLQI